MDDIYLGNPNLKKAHTKIEFTPDQIEEFIKCKEDPVYFAKIISRLCLWMKVLSTLNHMTFRRS